MVNITLKLGDCLELMKELPDNSIDAIVTDPPYGVLGKTQSWDKFESDSALMDFTIKWIELCYDKAKPNASLYTFYGQKFMKEMFNLPTRWKLKRMLIWWHPNLAKPTRKMYLWTYDPIFYFVKGKPHFEANFTSSENADVFKISKPQKNWKKDFRFHPASKPIELVKKLIKVSTKEGDTVLDLFMGSGTTGVACIETGRNFIGFEINPEYFKIAEKRINDALKQKRLGD